MSRRVLPQTPLAFVLVALGIGLSLMGLLRTQAATRYLLAPVADVQGRIALWHVGGERLPVAVAPSCSGLDVVALCLAFALAYPVAARHRLIAAAGSTVLLLALNTLRIVTLAQTAHTGWFPVLHLYVWPAVLVAAAATYIGGWMWLEFEGWRSLSVERAQWLRFSAWAAGLLVLYLLAAPWYLDSDLLLAAAGLTAAGASGLLGLAGTGIHLTDRVLWTAGGTWLVTPECVVTPLMPLYLALWAVGPRSWKRSALWLLGFPPVFLGLAILRLLTLALPPSLAGGGVITHAFYQLLLAGALVVAVAVLRRPSTERIAERATVVRIVAAGAVGLGLAAAIAATTTVAARTLSPVAVYAAWLDVGRAAADGAQGSLVLLPAFQFGLLGALAVASRGASRPTGWSTAAAVLLAVQAALFATLGSAPTALPPLLILGLRGVSLALPFVLTTALLAPRAADRTAEAT